MGNDIEAIPNRLKNAYNPNMVNWVLLRKENKVSIWQNKQTAEILQEYTYTATDKAQLYRLRSHFEHRFNKPYIVASKFFQERQTDELCSSFYEISMFLESIGLRLSEFRDVTFPDCLHLYNACLHGFGELQARLGFFDVSDSLVGINQLGQVKVWANPDFSKERPRLTATKQGESQMLKEVIELANACVDTRTQPESIKTYLNQNAKSFQQAVAALKQYAARYEVEIPVCLETVNYLREKNILNAGPFIKPEIKQSELATFPQAIPHPIDPSPLAPSNIPEDSKHPISLLQAEALRQFPLPIQKSKSPVITANPRITSVMYHPIDISGNLIPPSYPRQNLVIKPGNRKNSEQVISIHPPHAFESNPNNIKQSEIIEREIPQSHVQEDVFLINNHRPKNTELRPIYLSTPSFVQREDHRTAGNIATLNQKYYNLHPNHYGPDHLHPHPSLSARGQQHGSTSISNIPRNTQKRNPSIFTSLQGSNRRFNPKVSQQQYQGQFFNNTIIYSIENQVRRDELQAAIMLQTKRNKLRMCHPLQLSVQGGQLINNIVHPVLEQPSLKQSATQVFSITINNTNPTQNHEIPTDASKQFPTQQIQHVHFNLEQQPIRYTENQLYTQQFGQIKSPDTVQSPTENPYNPNPNPPQRYNYVPNYSFDKNYQHPMDTQESSNFVERREVETLKQDPTHSLDSIPKHQSHYESEIHHKQTEIIVREELASKSEIVNGSNLVLKATIKNPYTVQSSLKTLAFPTGNSASDIISSIQEIRNSQKQLRQDLKQFI